MSIPVTRRRDITRRPQLIKQMFLTQYPPIYSDTRISDKKTFILLLVRYNYKIDFISKKLTVTKRFLTGKKPNVQIKQIFHTPEVGFKK